MRARGPTGESSIERVCGSRLRSSLGVGFRCPLVIHSTAWAFDDGRLAVVRSAGVVESHLDCSAVSIGVGLWSIVVVDGRPCLVSGFDRCRLTN